MANSFSFNNIDLSDYDLELMSYPKEFLQQTESLQVLERAWGLTSRQPARQKDLQVVVKGTSLSDLMSNLDNIKKALNRTNDCKLAIASLTDRYWMARYAGMIQNQEESNATLWKGTISFMLYEPMAYDADETDHDHTIGEQCDDFEWGNDGDDLDDSGGDITWTISVAGTSEAEIDTAQQYAGTRSARFYRDGANDAIAYFTQAALGDGHSIRFRFRKDTNSSGRIYHGNGTKYLCVYIHSDESIYYYDGDAHDTGSSISIETQYLLEIKNIDWTAGTFDIYLDGLLIKSGATMATSASYEDQVYLINNAGTSEFWIDNIAIVGDEITETPGGSGRIYPVITITPDFDLDDVDISIENETTVETFEISNIDIDSGDELVIDCETGLVTLNGVNYMASIGNEFISLLPGANSIIVTGFPGNINFTYRERYL